MTAIAQAPLAHALMTQALTSALLHFVWQGLLVGVLLWLALFLLRKRSPNARYLASCAALAVLTALPLVTACLVYYRPLTPAAARLNAVYSQSVYSQTMTATQTPQTLQTILSSQKNAASQAIGMPQKMAAPHGLAAATAAAGAAWTAWLNSLLPWTLPLWSFGVLLFSVRLLWGCWQASSLRHNGKPAQEPVLAIVARAAKKMGIARPARVLISSIADAPGLIGPISQIGWLRPVILLPAATLAGLPPEQLEAVLAHELAHIRRYDYLVNLLQMLVETLFFYHPAVWWISSRIRHERELCCDDLAVRSCGDALCYARALTAVAKIQLTRQNFALGAAALSATDGPLLYRIRRLLGAPTPEHRPSRLPGIVAICLALSCLTLTANWSRLRAEIPGRPPRHAILDIRGISTQPRAADWPGLPGTTEGFVRTTDGIQLHFIDWGGKANSGEAMLLLNDAGGSIWQFSALAPKFTDRLHVLGMDRRGQGWSEKPSSGYSADQLVDDIKVFLDAMNVQRVTLVGNGLGGDEETLFADRYPERVAKLIYLNPVNPESLADLVEIDWGPARMIQRKDVAEKLCAMLAALPRPCPTPANPMPGPTAVIVNLSAESGVDYAKITAPVLSFFTVYDKALAPPYPPFQVDSATERKWEALFSANSKHYMEETNLAANQFQRRIPNAQVVRVHGDGGGLTGNPAYVDLTQQETVASEMRKFLLRP